MAVEINNVNAQVNIRDTAPTAAVSSSSSSMDVHDLETLKALLRPMVMEIIQEELSDYTRQRG